MMRSWWLAFAVLAVGVRSWAKPPDLPTDKPIECVMFDDEPARGRFSIELGITSKGVTLKFGAANATPEPPAVIDAVCPNIVPAYLQALLERMKGVFAPTPGMSGVQSVLERDKKTAQLFEVGEIYRRTGHYASARTYYQRVRDSAPSSRLGRLAMERVNEIDDRMREAEESSDDQSELRDGTIPLGLAQQATY